MPIKTIRLTHPMTPEEKVRIWFIQLKSRLKKHQAQRAELRAQGKTLLKPLP